MSGDTWKTMCPLACLYKTHGKPCVRHMASRVSTCMEDASSINRLVRRRRGEEERKREREERRERERRKERRKERKKKGKGKESEKKEGGRRFLPQFIGVPTVETR